MFHAIASRRLGVDDYGALYALISLYGLGLLRFRVFAPVVTKYSAEFGALHDDGHVRGLIGFIIRAFVIVGAFYVVAGFCTRVASCRVSSRGAVGDPDRRRDVAVANSVGDNARDRSRRPRLRGLCVVDGGRGRREGRCASVARRSVWARRSSAQPARFLCGITAGAVFIARPDAQSIPQELSRSGRYWIGAAYLQQRPAQRS